MSFFEPEKPKGTSTQCTCKLAKYFFTVFKTKEKAQQIKYTPLYKIPSVLLQGEAATSSGIVNGSFFNPSKLFPKAYKLPSFGSGKNAGLFKETTVGRHSDLLSIFPLQFCRTAKESCFIPLTLFQIPPELLTQDLREDKNTSVQKNKHLTGSGSFLPILESFK